MRGWWSVLAAVLTFGVALGPGLAARTAVAADDPVLVNRDVPDADRPLNADEQAVFDLINDYRTGLGLDPFGIAPSLLRAARWKAEAMALGAPFAHDDPDRTWDQRAHDCGYPTYGYVAEDMEFDPAHLDPAGTLRQWQDSPLHDANLRGTDYHYAGIARVDDGSAFYWVLIFGSDFG
jgi:uncharacterized protein YkwD